MKVLTFANFKGGVGKSALATQLSYYLTLILKKRVLLIDLDHQRNSTKAVQTSELATVAEFTSYALLSRDGVGVEPAEFVLLPGDTDLLRLERQSADHNAFASRLLTALAAVADDFDVCIIDTNPNPDIRLVAALTCSDFVVSPIQLNQEAIDGIGELLNNARVGLKAINRVQAQIGKKAELIGILPNLVEPTPFQKDNFLALSTAYPKLLIPMSPGFAAIKKTTAVAEAQAAGVPVWKLGKTSGREAWAQIKPVFDKIAKTMELK